MRTNPFAQFDYAYDLIARSRSAQRRLRIAWSDDSHLAGLTLPEVTKILRTPGHPDQDATIGALITLAQNGVPDATIVIINGILPALIASCSRRRLISRDGLVDELGYTAVITIGAFNVSAAVDRLHLRLVSRFTARLLRPAAKVDLPSPTVPDVLKGVTDRTNIVEDRVVVEGIEHVATLTIGKQPWDRLWLRVAYETPIADLPNPLGRSNAHLRADLHRHLRRVQKAVHSAQAA